MKTQIFVNLPVTDLKKSMDFFQKLGYNFNMKFTNDDAACMVISDHIYAMLLTHPFFLGFIPKKKIADAHQTTEVLLALSTESKAHVDQFLEKAIQAGGKEARDPQDHGFMYSRSFEDLDGHIWEIFWMDNNAAQ